MASSFAFSTGLNRPDSQVLPVWRRLVAIKGVSDASVLLSSKLSPSALVRLACDLLFLKGHTGIRITDGPGDGGRDIHSVTVEGQKHLTQCKFHKAIKKTVSSAELAELPMAMVKLDYSIGLFITNAKISPQGKRECLDSYSQLELEFFDGDTLAGHVFDTGPLRAVWFDGKSIAAVNTSVTFSTIVRRHSDDASILPFKLDNHPPPDSCIKYLSDRYPGIKFSAVPGRGNPEVFEPYRAPEPFTAEEGSLPWIQALDIVAAGDVALYKIDALSQDVCRALLLWLGDGITVRIGTPALMPLTGESSGARVLSEVEAKSFIATRHSCGEERAWFSLNDEKLWDSASDARVSEASHIRLYSRILDCVASYEIQSRPSAQQRGHAELMHELTLHSWERSVFALVPASHKWESSGVPLPKVAGKWPWDGRLLCGWFHWYLQGGAMPVRTAAISDPDMWDIPTDAEEEARLEPIRSAISKMQGIEVLAPNRARHMAALIGSDPLMVERVVVFNTAEVADYIDIVPSPIRPQSRRFGFAVAWRGASSAALLQGAARDAGEALQCGYLKDIGVERYDQDLLLTASIIPSALDSIPSDLILADLHAFLGALLPRIEKTDGLAGVVARCTKEFWLRNFNIGFGVSPRDSKKAYVMVASPDGDISPLGIPPELLRRKR